jgi:hypothetical protein
MRRRRTVRQFDPVSRGGLMSYVLCPNPKCGDPVAGRIPQSPEELKLTCVHCKETFAFKASEVRSGLVFYNTETKRWGVQTLASTLRI